jgi:3-methylcrotonyl-CoA carboxylase beta subunit
MKLGSPLSSYQDQNTRYHSKVKDFLKILNIAMYPSKDEPAIKKHIEKKKLFVRDRIALLLDPLSPFLEIGALAGFDMYEGVRAGAGIVTGIGSVSGKQCMIVANDATIKGGAYYPITVKKHLRAQEIAFQNKLPCIYLVDSGGAFLPMQDEVFPDKEHFGRIFYNQAQMSRAGILQVAAVMGSCTAGGAYVPAMSDVSVIVKNQGTIFLGGPPLVKAATGEIVTAEELGGGFLHASESGVADYLAENDEHALSILREVVASTRTCKKNFLDKKVPVLPLYHPEEVYSLFPSQEMQEFPIREFLARVLDGSELDEFKALYGETLICGFARIYGILVGIVANDGILYSESALKGTHFIQLCSSKKIPILFFQNITGFMVGREYERRGIAKDGAKLVNAVANADVPKITFIIGSSYGAGNYGMCGRAYSPRFLFSIPGSKIAVMGTDQASSVLTELKVSRGNYDEEVIREIKEKIKTSYAKTSSEYYATARLWDDGIIDPATIREVIALCLEVCFFDAPNEAYSSYGVFRM